MMHLITYNKSTLKNLSLHNCIEVSQFLTTINVGLQVSSSTRAAFLIQATALWTPGLAAAFGLAPSPLLWASSLTALLSTLLVTFDQADGAGPAGDLVSSSLLGNLSVGAHLH